MAEFGHYDLAWVGYIYLVYSTVIVNKIMLYANLQN